MKSVRYFPEDQVLGEMKKKRSKATEDAAAASHNNKDESHYLREEEEDKTEIPHVTHGYDLVKGKMDHGMEDYVVVESRRINGHDIRLYAIFDGHSGRDVAKYLHTHLFDKMLSQSDLWRNPEGAIKRAYKEMDDEILEDVAGSRGGSTAVTAILIDRKKLMVANVGDSRAILCGGDGVKQVTIDHEPNKEKQVVESRGGFVSKKPGNVPRVDGQLAMTRAFGDGNLKEHITSEPNVRIEIIEPNTVEFIILASDGLWKVMSSEEAFDEIREYDDAQEASQELIKEALARGSRDDISCIVLAFDWS
ncbi:putative protein phosphatase 2C 28 isoform X1 [Gossypium australe]|uniref:protein-serine/threonine phosphatase n=1 Tax=Gossypium australe TaxID=47621 RepID=A0A5B6UHU1_9ROSI|nr:putative protein phosphatase 2C 28 isoform X1 [Gossypium australe]